MAFKIKKPKLKFHTRTIIAGAFVLLICGAAYADHIIGKNNDSVPDYIYTSTASSTENEDEYKILGEAAFVDNKETVSEQTGVTSEENIEAGSYDTYFSAMQVDRQRSRQDAYEILQNVVDSPDSMPDVKEKAYNEMMVIANNITIEENVRSMVMAKGFDECLAVINGNNLNVVVRSNGLLMNEVAQIKEIAVNESGFPAENIKVVEKAY